MKDSNQKRREQKTSYEGYLGETRLETERVPGAPSGDMASYKGKTKLENSAENLLERIVSHKNMNKAVQASHQE